MKNAFLAGLIIFLMIIFLGVFIVASQAKALTSEKFITNTINNSDVISKLPDILNDLVLQAEQTGQGTFESRALTKVVIKTIQPSMLEDQLAPALTDVLNYIEGKTTKMTASIDLTGFKTAFVANWPTLAPTIFREQYTALPQCASGQSPLQEINGAASVVCQSPGLPADMVAANIQTADTSTFLNMVPDEFDLADFAQKNADFFNKARLVLNALNFVFWLSLILTILSVAGLVAINWPNWRAITGINGWVFAFVSAPILIADLLSPKFIDSFQTLWQDKLPASVSTVLTGALQSINQTFVSATIVVPAIIFTLGAILIILSFVLPKYEPKITPPGFNK